MIASSADIAEFVTKVKHKSIPDVVLLADREATEAERLTLRTPSRPEGETETYRHYALALKDFVQFIRYGVKTSGMRRLDLNDFQGFHLLS